MKKSIVVTILLMLVGSNAFSAEWVGPTTITKIMLDPSDRILIKVPIATPSLGCPGYDSGSIEMNTSRTHFDKQYALLLAAFMANKQVDFEIEGCGYYPYLKQSNVHE